MTAQVRKLGCMVVAAAGAMMAGHASGATITVGDGGVGGTYHLNVYIDTPAEATGLLATTGTGAMAYASSGMLGSGTATSGHLYPAAEGSPGMVIYHFQADPGFRITEASVKNSINMVAPTATDFIQPSYSTSDNAGSYVDYGGVVGNENDLTTHTFSVGAQDLYLRYDLQHDGNAFVSRNRLFHSTAVTSDTPSDGWTVDLTITPAPEPASATLALVAMSGLALVRRRRGHLA